MGRVVVGGVGDWGIQRDGPGTVPGLSPIRTFFVFLIQPPSQKTHPDCINSISLCRRPLHTPFKMARKAREYTLVDEVIIHGHNWSVDKRPIFLSETDCDFFVELLRNAQQKSSVSILVYSLIPSGIDLILHQHEPYAVAAFMKYIEEEYACWFNRQSRRNGPVFSGRYRGEIINDEHELLRISWDIHVSSAVSALHADTTGNRYSSCRDYRKGSAGSLEDTSLILSLVGGADRYALFLDHFDPARPASVELFLCADHEKVWAEKGLRKRSGGSRLTQVERALQK
jgi:hypothetical protein